MDKVFVGVTPLYVVVESGCCCWPTLLGFFKVGFNSGNVAQGAPVDSCPGVTTTTDLVDIVVVGSEQFEFAAASFAHKQRPILCCWLMLNNCSLLTRWPDATLMLDRSTTGPSIHETRAKSTPLTTAATPSADILAPAAAASATTTTTTYHPFVVVVVVADDRAPAATHRTSINTFHGLAWISHEMTDTIPFFHWLLMLRRSVFQHADDVQSIKESMYFTILPVKRII